MDFLRVELQAPAAATESLARFYGARLGLEQFGQARFRIGATDLEFVASGGEPFYHFAVLVPGNRFDSALEWVGERVELLRDPDSGESVFDFSAWRALACYFHDPARNIVELIAHRGIGESETRGAFSGPELLACSELGLVGDVRKMAAGLARLGLHIWSGTVDEPGRLAFVGEQARTIILCPKHRGWLPTGQPAEAHPVRAVVSGPPDGDATIDGHRISRRRPPTQPS